MSYEMSIVMSGLGFGFALMALNRSRFYGVLVLVVVSSLGFKFVAEDDVPFLSRALLLICLGGMLVLFCYSAALAADPRATPSVALKVVVCLVVLGVTAGVLLGGWDVETCPSVDELEGSPPMLAYMAGAVSMYYIGGGLLLLVVWGLLVALFVFLSVCAGAMCGSQRPH